MFSDIYFVGAPPLETTAVVVAPHAIAATVIAALMIGLVIGRGIGHGIGHVTDPVNGTTAEIDMIATTAVIARIGKILFFVVL